MGIRMYLTYFRHSGPILSEINGLKYFLSTNQEMQLFLLRLIGKVHLPIAPTSYIHQEIQIVRLFLHKEAFPVLFESVY